MDTELGEAREVGRSRSQIFTTLTATVGPTVVALGLLLYVLLRFSYSSYYGAFAVTPEEVGLGYQEILAQSGLVLILLLPVAVVIPIIPFAIFLKVLHKKTMRRVERPPRFSQSVRIMMLDRQFVIVSVVTMALLPFVAILYLFRS